MATKIYDLQRNVSVPAGAGLTFDPLLRDIVAGAEAAVAPDIVIPIPKATAASAAVTTAMATGNMTVVHNNVGAIVFDILTMRLHTIQRVTSGGNKNASISLATAIADGAGTNIDPLLSLGSVLQAPSICIPIPKTVPTLATTQSFVPTVLATGNINIRHSEGAPVNHDVLMPFWLSFQNLIAAVFGGSQDKRRYFTILNTAGAIAGAVYSDTDDATRQFVVSTTKVNGDGSLLLRTVQIAGTTVPTVGGADTLTLVSGSGDATIAYTNCRFEKYIDIQGNTAVANGAGLTFNPGLVENGTPVMPDIVIPIPKVIGTVPFVATDLAGAVGSVTVQHNGGAPAACDILSLRAHSIFRDT